MKEKWKLLVLIIIIILLHDQSSTSGSSSSSVSYDGKSLIIDGHRRILFSGSIHYPRSTPQMWEDLVVKAKDGGLDVIDTYVFWNVHQPSPDNNYDFEGRYDLVAFIKTVHKVGLYVHLRIGPYICAEWNFGGFPVWLKFVPGISFRTDNQPFKLAMKKFTEKIVKMMKDENLFHSQGGPIILSQIENEYDPQMKKYGGAGEAYMTWAAHMAVGLDTGVPWVMCKQQDAPDPIINTCNGFYCDYFSPNKPYKPTMWTEAWTGWLVHFGGPTYHRPVEDLAFAVARFIQKGGSFVNYYMFHGGTNFGRTAGGPFITTSYDYDALIDEYGLIRQPKYGHLKQLHDAVKMCEPALLTADPTSEYVGNSNYIQARVYSSNTSAGGGGCAAFLANYHLNTTSTVTFRKKRFNLPPWSITILPDCINPVFNTATVLGVDRIEGQFSSAAAAELQSWESFTEDVSSVNQDDTPIQVVGLLEQLNLTRDATDYLWYTTTTSVDGGAAQSKSFLQGDNRPTLRVHSSGHGLHVFINGHLSGSGFRPREEHQFTYTAKVDLHQGTNQISLLSVAAGLPNIGSHFERHSIGILSPVTLDGLEGGQRDLTWQKWSHKVGLRGESMNLYSPDSQWSSSWTPNSSVTTKQQPLTWYKAQFDSPEGEDPLGLNMGSMGKGQVWINGQSIGRYWTANAAGNCSGCSSFGTYRPVKCQFQCGSPTQKWYHVPRSWLKPSRNLLVIFEEIGGDYSKISIAKRTITT